MLTVGKTFETYGEWALTLKNYEDTNYIYFYKRSSITISEAKKKKKRKAANCSDDVQYYKIDYACAKGGKNFKSKSSGQRRHKTMQDNCPARIKISINDNYQLCITEINNEHNHRLDEFSYKFMARNRKLNPSDKEEMVHLMQMKANSKDAQNYIMSKTNKIVSLKDIRNIKSIAEAPLNTNKLEEIIPKLIQEGDSVKILRKSDKNLRAIYYQSKTMKQMFKYFPEILMCDGTYKLNNLRMPLYLLLTVDGNGHSEIVCSFLLVDEDEITLSEVIQLFKKENANWDATKTIFTDKDMKECHIFKQEFPDARLLLCLFHTLKTFRREITVDKMKISSAQREQCLTLIQRITYSHSDEEYIELYQSLINFNFPKVTAYYEKNWHDIKEQWVCAYRRHRLTFGNNTTNRLENINQKLKAGIEKLSSLDQFFTDFKKVLSSLRIERDKEVHDLLLKREIIEFKLDTYQWKYHNLITPFAWKHLLQQFSFIVRYKIKENLELNEHEEYILKKKTQIKK
ncbi:hypothetical protein Zmor_011472 [Zophobas morio]|uniref:MULE transposase domain-containing protein n=1 Tax=Zophobas morio TaxID=2755281 RepID=A0AA38IV70_9CUCU|nr:hypothetical protein Zmor_011472 [Zophobas morio]